MVFQALTLPRGNPDLFVRWEGHYH